MLIVLLIRGLTLPGAAIGIQFYLYPDLGRLADPQVGAQKSPLIDWCWLLLMGCTREKEKQLCGSCKTGPHQVLVSHGSQLELLVSAGSICWPFQESGVVGIKRGGLGPPYRTVNMSSTTRTKQDTFSLPQIFSLTLFDLKRAITMSWQSHFLLTCPFLFLIQVSVRWSNSELSMSNHDGRWLRTPTCGWETSSQPVDIVIQTVRTVTV